MRASADDSGLEAPLEAPPRATDSRVDVSRFENPYSLANKCGRVLWRVVWLCLFRPSPRLLFGWRALLLRCFGADVGTGVHVYPTAKIWAPWNLTLGDHSCLADDVDCYCPARVVLGPHAVVSQYAYLCTAGHDIADPNMRLTAAPITIGAGAWVCAGAYLGPGVRIGEGAVVAARAVVVKAVEPWNVVGGNPAQFIKKRELRNG
jgi:putative colanic acid biosynthesis acetyltransferase WcaF